jgi:hypothetical protein
MQCRLELLRFPDRQIKGKDMSALSDIQHRLRSEWSALEYQWRLTRSQWDDSVGDRFENEYWQEMDESLPTFLKKLEHVDETLEQAVRILNR